MRAMVLRSPGDALEAEERPEPEPGPAEVLVRVRACGVCRTDLHIVDGELDEPKLPLVLGHQVVGEVAAAGEGAERFAVGDRIGIPWLGWTCGECRYCHSGRENLCERAVFTGYGRDGGYAESAVADERFCFPIPDAFSDESAAPLLCAGLIGFRALRMCGDPERLGLYGFGSSAQIVCQVAAHEGRRVFAITRGGKSAKGALAGELGAEWTGTAEEVPEPLDAAIIFAPAGELVPVALRALAPGGSVVCAGIHMSDVPGFPYADLWGERQIRSVANLTRRDGEEFLPLAERAGLRPRTNAYALADATRALGDVRAGSLRGTAVLLM